MSLNYNDSGRRTTSLSEIAGSNRNLRTQFRELVSTWVLCLLLLVTVGVSAQTTLISPTGAGGFENGTTFADNGWTTVNAATNTWQVGTAPGWFSGSRGAYISSDSGTSWTYNNGIAQRSHFYRDVTFPAGETSITLTFDLRINGNDGNWDNMQVYLANTTVTPTTSGPTGQNTTSTTWPGYTDGTTGFYLLRRNGTSIPTSTTTVTYTFTTAQATYAAGNTRRLIFTWKNDGTGGSNPPASVDNISLVSSCNGAVATSATSLTTTSAVFNWNAFSGATLYDVRYRVVGNPTWTTVNGVTGTSTLVTGLTPNTNYEYQVSATNGSCTLFGNTISFRTGYCVPSNVSTTYHITNFTMSNAQAPIVSASGAAPSGYADNSATISGAAFPGQQVNFSISTNTGTHNFYMWIDWNNDFDFTDSGESIFATTAFTTGYTGNYTIPVATPLGSYRMRIASNFTFGAITACNVGTGGGDFEDYTLNIVAAPTCFNPTGLAASAITNQSATVSWVAPTNGVPAGYEYEIRTSGAGGSGSTGLVTSGSTTAPTVSANVTGLSAGTVHSLYVRTDCGASDFSVWAGPFNFTTQAVTALSWTEGFNGGVLPAQWAVTSGFWNYNTTPAVPATNGNYARINLWSSTTTAGLTTPNLGVVAPGMEFRYDYALANFNSPFAAPAAGSGNFVIAISTDFGATYTTLETVANDGVAGWRTRAISLTPYVGQIVKFRITGNWTSGDYLLAFDNFLVTNCFPPTPLTVSNLTATSADLSWTAPSVAPASGYEWAVTTSATPPATGTAETGTSASVTSLTANTQYFLHVRSACSSTDFSPWATRAFVFVPGDTCATAVNLATQTSPLTASNALASNDFVVQCISSPGKDLVYFIDVQDKWTLNIGLTASAFDSSHYLGYGGACPGTTQIACYDPNLQSNTWTNTTGSTQRVYFTVDAWGTGEGTFTLGWSLVPPPIVIDAITPATACADNLATTVITITGSNLANTTDVKLNGVSTPFTVISDAAISVALTATSTAGTFTVINPDTQATSAASLTIIANPTVAPITFTGDATLCAGGTIDLDNTTPGGTWSSSNALIATVDQDGVVTTLAAGTVTINYTVTDAGCTTVVSQNIEIKAPIVSSNPGNATVVTGNTATFSVTATGDITSYQWQVSTDQGGTYTDVTNDSNYSGATTNTLTIANTPGEWNQYLYQVIITGVAPCSNFISSAALLSVGDTGVAEDPASVSLCTSGNGIATFTVEGSGTVDAYNWFIDSGNQFEPVTDGTLANVTISGATTDTLTLSGITLANNGWKIVAEVVGPANGAFSNEALLTVNSAAAITSEPANASNCFSGGSSQFTVVATGNVSGYQWQYSTDGVTFANVANGTPVGATYSGATTAQLTVATTSSTPASGTYFYRAQVIGTSPCGTIDSAPAQLLINTPQITSQPAATTVIASNTTTFTVATSAPSPSYQWQYATALAGPYTNVTANTPAGVTYSGADTATLSVITSGSTVASTARFYRAVVTSNGCSVNSAGAQLTIVAYCTPNPSSVDGQGITNVTFGTINNTSISEPTRYGNYSNLITDVTQGTNVPFAITYRTGFTYGTRIWIDFNRDGDFTDAGEQVYSGLSASANPTVLSGTFAIPANAPLGATRLRIGGTDTDSGPSTPCYSGTFGIFEDYSVNIIPQPPCSIVTAGTVAASSTSICGTGTVTLTATGFTTGALGVTLQWHNSQGPIAGATSATYTTPVLSANESYFFRVTCENGPVSADSNTVNINVYNQTLDSTTGSTRCGTGTTVLQAAASAGSQVVWYSASTGGTALGTGVSFTTPVINATTSYFAAAVTLAQGTQAVGAGATTSAAAPTSFANGLYGGMKTQYLFTAAELNSAGIFAGNINGIGFDVTVAGSALQGFTIQMGTTNLTTFATPVSIAGGLTTVRNAALFTPVTGINTLAFTTPFVWDGTSNVIVSISWSNNNASNTSSTLRSDTTTNFASQSYRQDNALPENILALTGGTGVGTSVFDRLQARPRTFFTASSVVVCSTPRTAVVATVTPAPVLTLSAATSSICVGATSSPVTITSTVADYDSYTWSPSTGVSGDAASGYVFNPTTTTTYTLTASNSVSGCSNVVTHTVTVNALPAAPVVIPSTPEVCPTGAPVALSVVVAPSTTQGCLVAEEGQFPFSTFTSATCNGTTVNSVTTSGFASEYSLVSVGSLTRYVFTSSKAGDLITIGNADGTQIITSGPSPLTWDNLTVTGIIRFYTQVAGCGEDATLRTRSFVCGPIQGVVWSPQEGLFTNAAGTTPYTGAPAVTVFAKPNATTVYTATATNANNCQNSSPVTVTVLPTFTYYADADNDGFGNPTSTITACSVPAGYVTNNTDCDDTKNTVRPNAPEIGYNLTDDDCDGLIDEGFPPIVSTINPTLCNTTLTAINQQIFSTLVAGAQGYQWRVTTISGPNVGQVQTLNTLLRVMRLTELPNFAYGATYQIEVAVRFQGFVQPYPGATCNVTTPLPVCQLVNCDQQLGNIQDAVFANLVPFATGYRFRITDPLNPANTQVLDRNLREFRMSQITAFPVQYNKTYIVEVAVRNTDGTYLPFGAACQVTTPLFPTTGLQDAQCDNGLGGAYEVPTLTTQIFANSWPGVIGYAFRLTGPGLPGGNAEVVKQLRVFTLSDFASFGLQPGAEYSVQVRLIFNANDAAGPYGKVCTIKVPGSARIKAVDFNAVAYPNPFAENFNIDLTTSQTEKVTVKVYDMAGRLLEERTATVSEAETNGLGDRYPAGVYNVIVSQGDEVKTLRVIKR